jgi:hypothetical protein
MYLVKILVVHHVVFLYFLISFRDYELYSVYYV